MTARAHALRVATVASAAAHAPLRPRTLRVLLGVLALTAAADGPVDVTHTDIGQAAGLPNLDKIRAEIRELADAGLIGYRPGGPAAPSRVWLPAPGHVGRVHDATPSANGLPSRTVTR